MLQVQSQSRRLRDGTGPVNAGDSANLAAMGNSKEADLLEVETRNSCKSAHSVGNTAALSESGFLMVSKSCCNKEMYDFTRRTISFLALDVCDEDALMKLVPWFTCELEGTDKFPYQYYTGSFAVLQEILLNSKPPNKCSFLAPAGSCESLESDDEAECQDRANQDPFYLQDRACLDDE